MPDAKYNNAEELAHPTLETAKNEGRQRYCSSKLANVMWMYALHRHISNSSRGKEWTVTAFDPGLMPGTGLAREFPRILQFLWHHVLPHMIWLLRLVLSPNIHTIEDSGFALARLGVGEDVKGKSGVYYEGLKEHRSSDASRQVPQQDDLWEWTVKTVAKDEAERLSFEQV